MHIYCSNWQAGIYMHPSKGIAKKSSCFITVQSRFWDMDTFPWKWILRSSKIVHSPIECDWIFFSSTVAAVNNGKALHLHKGGVSHTQVFVDPTLGRIAITSRKPNYKVSHDLSWMTTFVTIYPSLCNWIFCFWIVSEWSVTQKEKITKLIQRCYLAGCQSLCKPVQVWWKFSTWLLPVTQKSKLARQLSLLASDFKNLFFAYLWRAHWGLAGRS